MVLPVIYPPQVAIIGLGQVSERPWAVDGTIALRKVATFSVAGDHRANDGRSALDFSGGLGNSAETGGTMTAEQLAELVKRTLYEVAPDLRGEPMDP